MICSYAAICFDCKDTNSNRRTLKNARKRLYFNYFKERLVHFNGTVVIVIGNNVLIGSGCIITDSDVHPLDWKDRREGVSNNIKNAPVVIGNDVFIGARSIILKGVTIGERSVIGAGSVVSKNVLADCIVAGNPAVIVKRLSSCE